MNGCVEKQSANLQLYTHFLGKEFNVVKGAWKPRIPALLKRLLRRHGNGVMTASLEGATGV